MKKIYGLLVGLMLVAMMTGCGGNGGSAKIDENKPPEQVAAEASKMGQAELQKIVTQYEAVIAEKGQQLADVTAKIKEIPLTKLLGEEAKTLKEEVTKIGDSLNKLKAQLAVYTAELSKK